MESISDFLNVCREQFTQTGAFNAILGIDSRLFVDPALIYSCQIPEFIDAKIKVHGHFKKILTLIEASKEKGDKCWRAAVEHMTFSEIKGISIGYSTTRANGNAIGGKLAEKIIESANEIISHAQNDIYFFELLGLFEKNIGADRISDIVISILKQEFEEYTKRIFEELNLDYDNQSILPTGENIILVPTSVISNLPHYEYTFNNEITDENVRAYFNAEIGSSWKDVFKNDEGEYTKNDVFDTFKNNPELFKCFIADYLKFIPQEYDLRVDPLGKVNWYDIAKEFVDIHGSKYENEIGINNIDNLSLIEKTLIICNIFKDLVENNKLSSLLYKHEKYEEPKDENAVQLLFFGISYFICKLFDIDLSPEVNTGRGPVDFKMSKGSDKVLIEVKKTLHSKLIHGYFTQLEEYKRSEKTDKGIFMVIIFEGHTSQRNLDKFKSRIKNSNIQELKSEIIYIDARKKASASKF